MYKTDGQDETVRFFAVIIDDDPDFAVLMRTIAEECGCEVELANSIANLGTVFANRTPDLICLDLVMPGEDGIEFLRFLQERQFSNEILILSAYERYITNAVTLARAHGLSCRPPIRKPTDAANIKSAIQSAISDAATTDGT